MSVAISNIIDIHVVTKYNMVVIEVVPNQI